MTCQNVSSTYSLPGDSGGPLFVPLGYGNQVRLVGLLVAGPDGIGTHGPDWYTVFSPWNRVEQNINGGGGVIATREATLATPSLSGAITGGVPDVQWSSVAGATYYVVSRQVNGSGGSGIFTVMTVTTATGYSDAEIRDALSVTGNPSDPWVTYSVYAGNDFEVSLAATIIFQRQCTDPMGCDQ